MSCRALICLGRGAPKCEDHRDRHKGAKRHDDGEETARVFELVELGQG